MKVLRTLVLSLGILLGCGCGRKVVAVGYGTYAGNQPTTYMGQPNKAYGSTMRQPGANYGQPMTHPTPSYNMPTYR